LSAEKTNFSELAKTYRKEYRLTVAAYDGGSPPYAGEATVIFKVNSDTQTGIVYATSDIFGGETVDMLVWVEDGGEKPQ